MNDIDGLTPDTLDREVLVPLTSSLYVPGKLGDTSHLIVDLGTGYYVKKVGSRLLVVRATPSESPEAYSVMGSSEESRRTRRTQL